MAGVIYQSCCQLWSSCCKWCPAGNILARSFSSLRSRIPCDQTARQRLDKVQLLLQFLTALLTIFKYSNCRGAQQTSLAATPSKAFALFVWSYALVQPLPFATRGLLYLLMQLWLILLDGLYIHPSSKRKTTIWSAGQLTAFLHHPMTRTTSTVPFNAGELPEEILGLVLAKVVDSGRSSDVAAASQTCKTWYGIISDQAFRHLQALHISSAAAHGPQGGKDEDHMDSNGNGA